LNAAPALTSVAAAQLRALGVLMRREFVVLGGLALVATALVIWGYTRVDSADWGPDPEVVPVFFPVAPIIFLIAVLWPFSVWRLDAPSQRGYFSSLPVRQPTHALLRVAAGWVTLMGVCLASLLIALALGTPMLLMHEAAELSIELWWTPFVSATLIYGVLSAFAVAFEHPIRVVIWIAAALGVVGLIAEGFELGALADALGRVVLSFWVAFAGPTWIPLDALDYEGPIIGHYLLWLGIGLAATVVGARWHRDVG